MSMQPSNKPLINVAMSIANTFKCCVNSSNNINNTHHNNVATDGTDNNNNDTNDDSIDLIVEKAVETIESNSSLNESKSNISNK